MNSCPATLASASSDQPPLRGFHALGEPIIERGPQCLLGLTPFPIFQTRERFLVAA